MREEMAVCIEDVPSRRLGLQLFDFRLSIRAAPVVAETLACELNWSSYQVIDETHCYVSKMTKLTRDMR